MKTEGELNALMKRQASSQAESKVHTVVDPNHPLVGTWIEEENPIHATTVVYTIRARAGRFWVSGLDESDGVSLRISDTTWDGERLRFVTLFPPTKHRASHEFWVTRKGRGKHKVRYSDEYGNHLTNENWKKRT